MRSKDDFDMTIEDYLPQIAIAYEQLQKEHPELFKEHGLVGFSTINQNGLELLEKKIQEVTGDKTATLCISSKDFSDLASGYLFIGNFPGN